MPSAQKKESYSPYDISKLCSAAPEVIFQWIERQKIPHFKVPGGHPRVAHEDLKKFFAQEGIAGPPGWEDDAAKYKILVVEDDPDLLEIVGELLKDEPRADVRLEDDGFSAGLHIAGWHPDLILLDFIMPGLNGFSVCKKIRENQDTKDIPVLALTSLSNIENRRAVMECGVSDFLGKPFHSEVLLKKVRTLLGLEREPAEPRRAGSLKTS